MKYESKTVNDKVYETVNGINYHLDEGVPRLGQISFDHLRNKSLNVVVDITGSTKGLSDIPGRRIWAKDAYTRGEVVVVGGGSKKEGESRIIIHVRGTIYSERGTHVAGNSGNGNRWSAALRTGTWSNIVSLDFIV